MSKKVIIPLSLRLAQNNYQSSYTPCMQDIAISTAMLRLLRVHRAVMPQAWLNGTRK